jgi:hypothetical protein
MVVDIRRLLAAGCCATILRVSSALAHGAASTPQSLAPPPLAPISLVDLIPPPPVLPPLAAHPFPLSGRARVTRDWVGACLFFAGETGQAPFGPPVETRRRRGLLAE